MECKKVQNIKICPCSWQNCPRKGICCQCLKYHLDKNEVPACFFSGEAEKTYNRSIENFIRDYQKNITRNE